MATRYCGPGGNDGNSGLTWALRKLTLNGVEDTPVVAGDDIYVGPGVYRETLTVDISGAGGNPITYIGDVTGENTDGVGGIVRITGSDNDQAATRSYCIFDGWTQRNYRTFRGFRLDMCDANPLIRAGDAGTNWIIEDCVFLDTSSYHIFATGANQDDWIIRRCLFFFLEKWGGTVVFQHDADIDNRGHLIENCTFISGYGGTVSFNNVGGGTVRDCLFYGGENGVTITNALAIGQSITVNNCVFAGLSTALSATAVGEIVENFNTFFVNGADRVNTNVGGNSQTYPPLLSSPILHAGASQISGFKFPWWFGELSEWSQVQAITGANEPTEDLQGIARPVTASKNSWGPIQFHDMERETGTVRTGSASLVLHDAGRQQIWVPVANESTTISIYVYREANYAGNLPQLLIKQPGQADDVTTDVGAASQWNLLTTTLTPAADPPYVVVELVSRNTAVALAYEVFWDDLVVS